MKMMAVKELWKISGAFLPFSKSLIFSISVNITKDCNAVKLGRDRLPKLYLRVDKQA